MAELDLGFHPTSLSSPLILGSGVSRSLGWGPGPVLQELPNSTQEPKVTELGTQIPPGGGRDLRPQANP